MIVVEFRKLVEVRLLDYQSSMNHTYRRMKNIYSKARNTQLVD